MTVRNKREPTRHQAHEADWTELMSSRCAPGNSAWSCQGACHEREIVVGLESAGTQSLLDDYRLRWWSGRSAPTATALHRVAFANERGGRPARIHAYRKRFEFCFWRNRAMERRCACDHIR